MKFTDLREKGPIIGAPKGSQKDSRLTPGTDDPSKYMRGGEWEAYKEPQGVNSNAGKIAGGTKKGTTKTKNTKVSEWHKMPSEKSLDGHNEILNQYIARAQEVDGVLADEFRDWRQKFAEYMSYGEYNRAALVVPHVERLWKRHTTNIGEGIGDYISFLDKTDLGKFKRDPEEEFAKGNKYLNMVTTMAQNSGNEELANKLRDTRVSFSRHMNRGEYENAIAMLNHAGNLRHQAMGEGIQSGGPGVSGDLVPADRHATTIAMVKDTSDPNIKKSPKLAGSEAPTKFVKKQIKKSHDNRPGNISDIKESVNRILAEAIPRVLPSDYSADYDLRDDKNQESIGVASITHGVIELLSVRNDVVEDYNGHIMSRLLSTIVRDADAANAHLAIPLENPDDLQHKRFLERFGFRAVGKGIMKRNAGSVTPPSVPSNSW